MKKLLSLLLSICILAGIALLTALPAGAEDANPYAPPANLASLSQAEMLNYFNLVVNRVRAEKPGFQRKEWLKVDEMEFTGLVGAVSGIIDNVMAQLMPGAWNTYTIADGQDNKGNFMSLNPNASDLRPEDIKSIKCTKEGDRWVIEVAVKDALNPQSGLGSTVARIADMQTREEIFEAITDSSGGVIVVDLADTGVLYNTIYASVTVNAEGKVIAAANGFNVLASANNMRMLDMITTDTRLTQSSRWLYARFDWTDDDVPFPEETIPGPALLPALKWWQRLPDWLQWILRWVFFGWLWMD